ncbi:MAG: acyl carrier protein [Nitrospirales bacterium]|nr:acyl carrier protein [Nitrospira sp.]MDR4484818.1 acyl carrier protein [Nitrospirales bacterium]
MKSSANKSSQLSQQVYRTLGTYLQRDPKDLHPDDSLRDDLGLDSLQTIELVYEVESAFDLQIPDEDFGRLTTIGAVILYLDERTHAQGNTLSSAQATPLAKNAHSTPPIKKTKSRPNSKKSPT